ncbi:hypothetical protein GCM10010452_57670 [Crossiella cryophila]
MDSGLACVRGGRVVEPAAVLRVAVMLLAVVGMTPPQGGGWRWRGGFVLRRGSLCGDMRAGTTALGWVDFHRSQDYFLLAPAAGLLRVVGFLYVNAGDRLSE